MDRILAAFSLRHEKEDFEVVIDSVEKGVAFSGTNLWILVLAIFIASLGLNVNSTAVVIGAMLVSPLMGPIMGLGMGMAINDLQLLKKALFNYFFALVIGLATSTIFFLLSPINDASSEILSRTAPNIYDVLIALFGGFAGILAVSSRQKGNVVPGVAIATALMPPLCAAGYALASWNFAYFTGALYLFVINTVFIALATLVTARFLHFPRKHLEDPHDEVVARRIVFGVVILTLLPSIYFGYDIIQQNRFRRRADRFVDSEAVFPNDYLLDKTIDGKARAITLTYGGEPIQENVIDELRSKLGQYQLDGTKLEIKQGFAILNRSEKDDKKSQQINTVLNGKEKELNALRETVAATEAEKKESVAAIDADKALSEQIFNELKAQYPSISSCSVQRVLINSGLEQIPVWTAIITSTTKLQQPDRDRIEKFLKARVRTQQMLLTFEIAIVSPTH